MNFFLRISITFLLTHLCFLLFTQGYESPEPRMTQNVLKKFLNAQLVYPENALKNKEQGVVLIGFTIDEDGKIENSRVISSVSKEVDAAALDLFDLILWKPAYNYGKPIRGEGEFKIKYSTGKYGSLVKKRGYDQLPKPYEPVNPDKKIYSIKNLDKAPEARLDTTYLSVQDYILKNLEYPETAAKISISGNVKLRLVIETSGLPSNIMVIESVGGGCTEEAIRIVQQLKWIPGIKDQMAVRTCFNISIKFDPANQLNNKHIPNQTNTGM